MNKIKKFKQMNESKSYADTITLWPEELEVFSREFYLYKKTSQI